MGAINRFLKRNACNHRIDYKIYDIYDFIRTPIYVLSWNIGVIPGKTFSKSLGQVSIFPRSDKNKNRDRDFVPGLHALTHHVRHETLTNVY